MMNTRAVRGWRQMLANQGFVATVRIARDRVVQRFKANRHSLDVVSEPPADLPAIHPFDEHYSVDTSGLIWGEHLASGSPSDRWSTAYYGIAPSVFSTVMSKIQESLAGAAFIDLGSGKGRAVMLATQLPFSDVIGVELSPALHQVAKSNLAQFRAQVLHEKGQIETKIHLHCMDAARFDFPLQPLVLFMYHPFCKPVLKTVLRRLRQSLVAAPRPAHIVYINLELRELLDQTPFLVKIFDQTLPMSPEDCLADRVGSSAEECAIYRSTLSGS